MLNLISYEGNTNPNHNEILLPSYPDGYNQKTGNKSMVRMWENRNSHTAQVGIY